MPLLYHGLFVVFLFCLWTDGKVSPRLVARYHGAWYLVYKAACIPLELVTVPTFFSFPCEYAYFLHVPIKKNCLVCVFSLPDGALLHSCTYICQVLVVKSSPSPHSNYFITLREYSCHVTHPSRARLPTLE